MPVDAYRGAGRPEGIYVIERIVDLAARELGLGPDEIRRRNFIDTLPYQTPVESEYDSGDFPGAMKLAMEKADWAGFPARRDAAAKRGQAARARPRHVHRALRRRRTATRSTVKIGGEGKVTLISACRTTARGTSPASSRCSRTSSGIDAESIEVVQGDTDIVPNGLTGGSRFLAVGGVARSTPRTRRSGRGRRRRPACSRRRRPTWSTATAGTGSPAPTAGSRCSMWRREGEGPRGRRTPRQPGEVHVSERLPHRRGRGRSPTPGETRIERYTIVDDFGRTINPLLPEGQIHGGTVQGVGQALLEHGIYDPETGQLLTGSFMDYTHAARRRLSLHSTSRFTTCPARRTRSGSRARARRAPSASPPAVINAVVDALYARTGIGHIDMPATREKVWRALRNTPDRR